MTTPRIAARNDTCTAHLHSEWGRRRHGCTCPPSDTERVEWQRVTRRRRTGPRRVAVSHGADVDRVAVDLMVDGLTPARVTRAERLAAVAILTARGKSLAQIADRLRCHVHTVARYRVKARAVAGGAR